MNTDPATGRADQLARQAREAARVRALAASPEVVALRVERVGTQVDALLWVGIGLGLLFTMVNVQRFAAAGAPVFSAAWWAAWLLDPMVSLVLLAAEAGPQLRVQLAQAAAAPRPADDAAVRERADTHEPLTDDVHERRDPVPRDEDVRDDVTTRRRSGSTAPRRRLLEDYLAEARSALAAACATGDVPVVTPSWCRAITGCSAGTSVKLAAALRTKEAATVNP
jgi:hypothetical protein